MFCSKCGTQNPDNSRFCKGCGGELRQAAASAAAAAPAPAPAMAAAPAAAPAATIMSAPAAAAKKLPVKKPIIIAIAAVVVVALIVLVVSLFSGPGKVSYSFQAEGKSVGPVEFVKDGNDLVVQMGTNMTFSMRLLKEGTMEGGTIYGLSSDQIDLAGLENFDRSLSTASKSSFKVLVPDGFMSGNLKGKWIMWSLSGSSGSAIGVDVQDNGTGTMHYVYSMNTFPTSFAQLQTSNNTDNFTWAEQGSTYSFTSHGVTAYVNKVG